METTSTVDVSIVIISYNTADLLRDCIDSINAQCADRLSYEIIVVDNASLDNSCSMVEQAYPDVKLIKNSDNRGFAAANNQAMEISRGNCILLLNSDTIVQDRAVEILYNYMQTHSDVGISGPMLIDGNGLLLRSIGTYRPPWLTMLHTVTTFLTKKWQLDKYSPENFDYNQTFEARDVWVTGACLMIKRQVCTQIGFLDEHFFFLGEDCDWCYRAVKSGWQVAYVHAAVVTHLISSSGKNFSSTEKEIRLKANCQVQQMYYIKKHYGFAAHATYRLFLFVLCLSNLCYRICTLCVLMFDVKRKSQMIFKLKLACRLFTTTIWSSKRLTW